MIILKCRSSGGEPYADLNADVACMLNRKDVAVVETAYLKYMDAARSTLCAEACLWLAKITDCSAQEASESELIKEGLKCLEVSIKTLTNEDGTLLDS